jgi:hypothetical protein
LLPYIGDRPIPRVRKSPRITAGPSRQKRHQAASESETVCPPN